jgi:type VI secretion system protein ImpE
MTDHRSEAEEALKNGDPQAALKQLTVAVKAQPADVRLRIFLAQLLCVLGKWDRAHTQLNVCAEMDAAAIPMREMSGYALRCEVMRAAVFRGQRSPMIFGQPADWLAMLVESMLQAGQTGKGNEAQSRDLAARAFEAAPTRAGSLNGTPFEWIADADSRLGPVLEAFVNGRYYWVPFNSLAAVHFDAPTDLRDTVWLPAQLSFDNGGQAVAMVPVRYPGSEASSDGAILMARRTEWRDAGGDRWIGLGQRVLTTDAGDVDLLAARDLVFASADDTAATA